MAENINAVENNFENFLAKRGQKKGEAGSQELIKQVNDFLSSLGLHTLEDRYFKRAPNGTNLVISGIKGDCRWNGKFYVDIPFEVMMSNGKTFVYPLRINGNSASSFGIVYVPKLGDKFVLVKQYRLGAGKELLEFPRGFPESNQNAKGIDVLGIGKCGSELFRELKEEIAKDLDPTACQGKILLNELYQDSSTSLNAPTVVFVEMPTNTTLEGGVETTGKISHVLMSLGEIEEAIREGQIQCIFTLAAWGLYKALP